MSSSKPCPLCTYYYHGGVCTKCGRVDPTPLWRRVWHALWRAPFSLLYVPCVACWRPRVGLAVYCRKHVARGMTEQEIRGLEAK